MACPYVSWQWTAKQDIGMCRETSASIDTIAPGVPTPIVSPSDIS